MTEHAKFNFDLDFAKTTRKSKLMEQSDIDLLIAQAREQGYAEGLAAGQSSIESQTNQQLALAAEQIAGLGNNFLATLDQAQAHHLTNATALAGSVGQKLATHLITKFPQDEIDALLKDCLATLGKTAHLVIRCNDQLSDQIKPIAEQYAHQAGFDGRLIIMGEPDIALGDCRIEWSDGGLARDFDKLCQQVEQKIEQFVSLKSPDQAPIDPIEDEAATNDEHLSSEVEMPEEVQ